MVLWHKLGKDALVGGEILVKGTPLWVRATLLLGPWPRKQWSSTPFSPQVHQMTQRIANTFLNVLK